MSRGADVLAVAASGPVDATVTVPGSKSIANRALVCAVLAAGESTITGLPPGDDTDAMVVCLGTLGGRLEVAGDRAWVSGGLAPPGGPLTLHARLAGTTSRFVTAVAALGTGPVTIDGEAPLRRRPMGPLHAALAELGVGVGHGELAGHLPVTVSGPPRGGSVHIRGDVSSQYVTALALIGPMLPTGLEIVVEGDLVSRPYLDLTLDVMAAFGARATVTPVAGSGGESCGEAPGLTVAVEPGGYRPAHFVVEPDASSASYPLAVGAAVGGRVTVPALGRSSRQGDAGFAGLLAEMGCHVDVGPDTTTVRRDPAVPLRGVEVELTDMSDLVPTVAVLGTLAASPTRITGVGFVRGKESDRLGDLAAELARAGADVTVTDDGLVILPAPLHPARLATHHDHRLAMAFGVLGTAVGGIEVCDPSVVTKSWPGFWAALDEMLTATGETS